MDYPPRNRDVYFSEDTWRLLWKCARLVEKRFNHKVEAGELVTQGWYNYARFSPDGIKGRTKFVMSAMTNWAKRQLKDSAYGPKSFGVKYENRPDKILAYQSEEIKTSEEAEEYNKQKKIFHELLNKFPDRTQIIMRMRAKGTGLKEIAEMANLTHQRVHQIIKQTTKKIRDKVSQSLNL